MTDRGRTVLLVVVDQLSARWLEAAWDGVVPLPNLAALRDEGAEFDRAFTVDPVCTPARASLLTGVRPAVHGARDTGYRLDPAIPTVPGLLRDAGWRTGAFGKLHVAPQLDRTPLDASDYGFDVAAISEDSRIGGWIDRIRAEHPEHLDAALATVWMTDAAAIADDPGLLAELRAARERHPEVDGRSYVLPLPAEVSQSAWIADRACEFIRSAPASRDLFAYVGFVQPHDPYSPPADALERVAVDRIPAPIPPPAAGVPMGTPSRADADWRRDRAHYFGDLAHLDDQVGRLRDALRATDRDRDALLVFTADHGDLLHDHGLVGKGEVHFDGAIRVPLLVRGLPAVRGERHDLVDTTDLAPTILEWAEVPAPTVPVWPGDGRLPVLPGHPLGSPTARDAVLVERSAIQPDGGLIGWSRTIRTSRHRLTVHLGGRGRRLYDLVDDPDETRDLAADPAHADLVADLTARLLELVASEAHPAPARGLWGAGAW